jgi:hypothetical protein
VRGIGVRFSEHGLRVVMIDMSGKELTITGVAAGPRLDNVWKFITELGYPVEDTGIAVGLGPGNFLTCWASREEGMDDGDMENQLLWEFGKKAGVNADSYVKQFLPTRSSGFLFAARKKLIDDIQATGGGNFIVDVEPVALFNGCEEMGFVNDNPAILVSLEAEGISTIAAEGGYPVAVDSFSANQDNWLGRLPGLDFIGEEIRDEAVAGQFLKYVMGSVSRISSQLWTARDIRAERIILSGGGVYTGDIAAKIEEETGITTVVTDPFASAKVKSASFGPRMSSLGSAFTTCYGLALRALEG